MTSLGDPGEMIGTANSGRITPAKDAHFPHMLLKLEF